MWASGRPRHVGEHGVERERHDRDVHGERQYQPRVFAEHELLTADGLGEERVNAPALDLLRNQPDADEDRDEETKEGGGSQPQVLDDLDVLPRRQLSEKKRRRHQEDGKEHEVVGHTVPDRLAEDAERDATNRAHVTPPARRAWPTRPPPLA